MPGDSNVEVVVAGHITLDLFPGLDALSADAFTTPGRLFQIGGMKITTGGLVANTGLALHRLGIGTRLISMVGDDLTGQITRDYLRRFSPHLAENILIRPNTVSSYTIVLTRPDTDRTFLHCTGSNDLFAADDIDLSLVNGARWFHFGYPSLLPKFFSDGGVALASLLQHARASGAITSLDFTLPDPATPSGHADWRQILRLALPEADIFMPSLEEIVFLLRRSWYDAWAGAVSAHITRGQIDEIAAEILEMGPAIAGIKLGAQGLLLYGGDAARLRRLSVRIPGSEAWAGRCIEQGAFAVEVQGTTGAGDAAYAGLIAGLLRSQSPEEVARLACAAGAASVESAEAISGLRSWTNLMERFDGWPTRASQWLSNHY